MKEKTKSRFKLAQEIVARSVADDWDRARLEWTLVEVYREDEAETCLCGHYPINELCVIHNMKNGQHAVVGNVCVNKFLGLSSEKIFQGLRRIGTDEGRALNADAVMHAHERGWINDWERDFYLDTRRKRKLSAKQQAKRVQINRKVLHLTTNQLRRRA